jgi:hypothetical protein
MADMTSSNPVLLTSPDGPSIGQTLCKVSGKPFSWAYIGQDLQELRNARKYFQGQGDFLNTTDRFHQITRELRDPYLSFIYDIGRKLNRVRWWVTSLSFRSSYVSSTYENLCHVKAGVELVQNHDPDKQLIIVATQPLIRSLQENLKDVATVTFGLTPWWTMGLKRWIKDPSNMLVHRARFAIREVYRMIQSRLTIRRRNMPTGPIILLICWATSGNLSRKGHFHESYFGDVATRLEKLGHQVALVPMILRDVRYRDALTQLADSPFPILVPNRFMGIRQLIETLNASWLPHPVPLEVHEFADMDIASLVDLELRNDWVRDIAPEALSTAAFIRQLSRLGCSPTHIIYLFENHPWERALCWEVKRRMSDTVLVGYRHSASPSLSMHFHLAPGGEQESPLPDKLVTIGKYGARGLAEEGHHHGRVRVGGAFHMQALPAADTIGPGSGNGSTGDYARTVLIGTSIGPEAEELAHISANLFTEDDGIRVILKCHPLLPVEKIRGLDRERFSGHRLLSDEPIMELMQKCSLMIYSVSSVCIQALALGLPLIHMRPQINLQMDPLESAPDARLEANSLEDLQDKVRWLLDHREEYIVEHQQQWKKLAGDIYGPVTEESVHAFVD